MAWRIVGGGQAFGSARGGTVYVIVRVMPGLLDCIVELVTGLAALAA